MLKQKKKILILLLIFLVLIIVIAFISMNFEKNISNDKKETINNEKEENWYTPNGDASKINVYKSLNNSVVLTKDDQNIDESLQDYEYVTSYGCVSKDCNFYGTYPNKNYVIIYDGVYIIYDYLKNEALNLKLPNAFYNSVDICGYNENVYGLVISNLDNKYAYYSFDIDDFSTEFMYDYMYVYENVLFSQNKVIAGVYDDSGNEKNYVINTKTGKILWNSDKPIHPFSNENYVYYAKNYSNDNGNDSEIYNDSFELMFDGKRYSNYAVSKNGNVVILNEDDTFSIYNKENKLVKKSKSYKQVCMLFNDYVVVIDNDDYLKLINYDGNVITKFCKITDGLVFNETLSTTEKVDNETIINLVVEDTTLDEDSNEKYIKHYYNIDTKENKTEQMGIG